MLELAGVSAADGDDAAVNVELSDDRRPPFQLWTEGLRRAATQAQQADQDVLLGVLVGEEGLPATVGHVVPPYQLHLNRTLGYQRAKWTEEVFAFQSLPGRDGLCGGFPESRLLWS